MGHNSSRESVQGYYHWKHDVCEFILQHWDNIFGKKLKRKKTWKGIVSTNLSAHMDRLFLSGTAELGALGWWKLKSLDPPHLQLINLKNILEEEKERFEASPGPVLVI